jgi:cAMP-dependent protein kinase regulator
MDTYVKKNVPKSDEDKTRLLASVRSNLLFLNHRIEDMADTIDAFETRAISAGEVVIREGENGEDFFVVATGSLDVSLARQHNQGMMSFVGDALGAATTDVHVGSIEPGHCFGELALLYNTPRAATVTAQVDCTLWGNIS